MEQFVCEIVSNRQLTANVFEMVLESPNDAGLRPGQFVDIKIDGFYLRRPISVCDADGSSFKLIYKTVGRGTDRLSSMSAGEKLDVLLGLGNGYELEKSGDAPLLLGGGVGVPPLYYLARMLKKQGKDVHVVLGFNSADEIFYENEFKELGCNVAVTTADGSYGIKGFVTDALPENYSHVYTCGPEPMLKAVYKSTNTSGQYSFEERMGCGFGACMGCSCKTITGFKRICKDGPVLFKEEILWED